MSSDMRACVSERGAQPVSQSAPGVRAAVKVRSEKRALAERVFTCVDKDFKRIVERWRQPNFLANNSYVRGGAGLNSRSISLLGARF